MKIKTGIVVVALALLVGLFASARFYTDFLWLMSLGYEHVLLRTLTAQAAVFAAAFALSIVFLCLTSRRCVGASACRGA